MPAGGLFCLLQAGLDVGHVLVVEERGADDDVHEDEREPLEPVALAILHKEAHGNDRAEERDGLKGVQVEVKVDPHCPCGDHGERDDKDADLRGGANGDAQADVHLVLHGEHYGAGMLRGVAHDGQQDGGHKGQRHAPAVGRSLDGVDQVVRQHGHQNGEEAQPKNAAPEAQHGLLLVVVFACILLLVKEVLVRVELEREVGAVDEEHDDADEAAQADVVVGAVQLGVRGVQQVGQHEA
mmetsp:Transcript_35027/g.87755  ORF Transcript_35027/g.87755 Transcript_35027/m.87755 type:complete len:239 (+) Transcript_35027:293-1009(+)